MPPQSLAAACKHAGLHCIDFLIVCTGNYCKDSYNHYGISGALKALLLPFSFFALGSTCARISMVVTMAILWTANYLTTTSS